MNSILIRFLIIFYLSFQLPFFVWSAAKQADDKAEIIRKIVKKYVTDSGVDLDKIHHDVSQIVPLDPVKTEEYTAVIKKRDAEVKKKFPMSDQQLRKTLQIKAEYLYPLYKVGDNVSITYLLHGKPFRATGKYYRQAGNYIYIGSSKIARRNIPDEIASRFDAGININLKNKYVMQGIDNYHKKREEYSNRIFKDEIMQSQGYLNISQKWISVRDYIQMEMKHTVENNDKIQIKYGDRFAMQKNYTEAAKCYRRAAELGNSDAQYKLGLLYYHGHGLEKDSEQAIFWLRKAAEQGNKDGQYYLGMCYANGWGVDTDYSEACTWLKKSADQGHAEAHKLFLQYQSKLETKDSPSQLFDEKNNEIPAKIINNGPNQKISNGMKFEELCVVLKRFSAYCRCKNVKHDLPAFFDKDGRTIWYDETEKKIIYNTKLKTYKEKKAKLLNMYKPVISYINKFYSMPIKQLEKKHLSDKIYYIGNSGYGRSGFCCEWHGTALAQRGSAKAQFAMGARLLGDRFRYVFAGHFDRDAFEEDVMWLKLAGENGISNAYLVLGKKSFLAKDYKSAIIWYRKGAEAKNTGCMFELGEFCLMQLDDGIEALRWYIPAANSGHYGALEACAKLYSRNTKNTKADYRQAIKYYQKLIEQENRDKSFDYQGRIKYYKEKIENLKLKEE